MNTGPEAIRKALEELDLDSMEQQAVEDIKSGKKTKMPKAVKKLEMIQGLKETGTKPAEWMITMVPVLPTKFRPFAVQGKQFIPGDANVLYKDLIDIRNSYDAERNMFGDEEVGEGRLGLYDAVKSVYGFGPAVKPKTAAKGISGFLTQLTGSTAKHSFAQRNMMAKTQDNVSRSTIIVDPDLGMDQIGMPVDLAYVQYAPYVQRELVRSGMSSMDALKSLEARDGNARRALEKVVEERGIAYSRAPVWHKHGVLGADVVLTDHKAISINQFVTTGLGADFDGDLQIGRVVAFIPNSLINKEVMHFTSKINKKNALQKPMLDVTCIHQPTHNKSMKAKHTKLVIDKSNTGELVTIDLEDFPHGELVGSKKDNGFDIEFYAVPDGVKVLSYDEGNGVVTMTEVATWSIHRGKELEIVTLSDGSQIFTDDDPRAVYGYSTKSPSLSMERFTPTAAQDKVVIVPVVGHNSIPRADLVSWYSMESNIALSERSGDNCIPLTYNIGQLLGCISGDGWVDSLSSEVGVIHLADSERWNGVFCGEVLKTIDPAVTVGEIRHSKKKVENRYGDTTVFNYKGTNWMREGIRDLIGGEKTSKSAGSGSKRFPHWVDNSPEEFRLGLINGLIATDGSVSISNGKGKPQLMMGISSISLRLVRDAQRVLKSLGVKSSIVEGKTTIAGNQHYQLTVSTVDAKRVNLLARNCHERKRDLFTSADVSFSDEHKRGDIIPYPSSISSYVALRISAPKQASKIKGEVGDKEERERDLRVYYRHYDSIKPGYITRASALEIMAAIERNSEAAHSKVRDLIALADDYYSKDVGGSEYSQEQHDYLMGLVSVFTEVEITTVISRASSRAKRNNKITKGIAKLVYENIHALISATSKNPPPLLSNRHDNSEYVTWCSMARNTNVSWASITSVEKTGMVEVGYDLTVPGYETFMNSDGVILSNTVNTHVPSSREAIEEVKTKLRPSLTPASDRDPNNVFHTPKQEGILGLYVAATSPSKDTYTFETMDEALAAIRRGEVRLSDNINIAGQS